MDKRGVKKISIVYQEQEQNNFKWVYWYRLEDYQETLKYLNYGKSSEKAKLKSGTAKLVTP